MTHVTNGVHVPCWDSRWADHVWTEACGKARWLGAMEPLPDAIRCVTDEALWTFRAQERATSCGMRATASRGSSASAGPRRMTSHGPRRSSTRDI